MTRTAQVAFAALVLATCAAFVVAQRLKQAPKAVDAQVLTRLFSPNRDGVEDRARFSIRLRREDAVSLTVLDRESGRRVRELVDDREIPADTTVFFSWDGRRDNGRRAPNAYYKLLVTLRDQGRSSVANKRFVLDTRPPRPAVTALGPGRGPFIVPAPGPRPGATVQVADPGTDPPQWTVWRTDLPRPVAIAHMTTARGQRQVYWDGTVGAGRHRRPAPPGTYLVQVRTRDRAGNVGLSPPRVPPLKRQAGRPGVTVRYLAAQLPVEPLRAGKPFDAYVDARGLRYRWRLRRVGGTRTVAAGLGPSARLHLRAPGGTPGVYLLELRTDRHVYRTPLAVQPAKAKRRVLVVLPTLSWQGRNPIDDSGQGVPDTLDTTGAARLLRPYAASGFPLGFLEQEGPLLAWLQRHGLTYDVTTDAALLMGHGPALAGHRGVVLAGEPRWMPTLVGSALRRYVTGGGHVLSLGTDALRRSAIVRRDALQDPTSAQPADVFGSRIKPLARRLVQLLAYTDQVGLFAATAGAFSGYDAFEETASTGQGKVVAAAGEQAGRPVIVAYRLGRGLVIRTGLPAWSRRLGSDQETAAVMRRIWRLLSS